VVRCLQVASRQRRLLADYGYLNTQWQVVQLWVFCRIDYHLATPALAALARTEHIYKDEKFSDHAPITVDYDFTL